VPVQPRSQAPPARIRIQLPQPAIECGRWPVKRTAGDTVTVSADVFRDGHEVLRAVVRSRPAGSRQWDESPMRPVDAHHNGVRWTGEFTVDSIGPWQWSIQSWVDLFAGWRDEVARKLAAGQPDMRGEASEGAVLLRQAAEKAKGEDRSVLESAAQALDAGESVERALDAKLAEVVARCAPRSELTDMEKPLDVYVDTVLGRFGSWYELFPRSFGGFRGVQEQIPALQDLGFDVLYLPPIHPIGHRNRKGRNNTLLAEPGDPGSPWAIGDETGGHADIHQDLGTIEEFDALVQTAREHDIFIALDFAIQASADHPWLTEHPEWFNRRPDGTLKYAENPPKKYQDIYNFNWNSEDWQGLWNALLEVVRYWVSHGVRVFRVDNPHTKPLPFWEWLIKEIHSTDPDVIFLAEAFTKRAMMRALAKLGFTQSYTYFTWKNTRWEIEEYVNELAHTEEREYFRPNFFVNTPDILSDYLAEGGPPAFAPRLILAATLSPTYGVYSGFEHFEHIQRPGSEENIDNEKYEVKKRRLDGPLLPLIKRINQIRRDNPALQRLENIRFLETQNDALVAYAKREGRNIIITVVNVDPANTQEGLVAVPYELGVPPAFTVTDLLDLGRYDWHVGGNYVRLNPWERAGHVLHVDTP
jgi:starch synthase (maltosyl-transferring)